MTSPIIAWLACAGLAFKLLYPFQPGKDPWWWKVEPIMSMIRLNCQSTVKPSNYVATDEIMIPFRGRSSHKVKMKGKPIPEGFKIWGQDYDGYIEDWLMHSPIEGPECTSTKLVVHQPIPLVPASLAPTFQVPWLLAYRLRQRHPNLPFLVILDNLFLNTEVAHCLMTIKGRVP